MRVHGLRLRYARTRGDGMPLLFCNGIGANLELAVPLARALAGVPVVIFDLPGNGGSAAFTGWPTFRRYARTAVAMLDALGEHGDFAVAGASWGGALAQQIARDFPERAQALILMASTPGLLMIPGRLSALLRMATPRRYRSRQFMAANAAMLYGGELRGRSDRAADLATLTRAPSRTAYVQQLLAGLQFSSLPWLHHLRCPALVLSGADDPIVRPINARLLALLLRNVELRILPGAGHLFMLFNADETARVVRRFMRRSTT